MFGFNRNKVKEKQLRNVTTFSRMSVSFSGWGSWGADNGLTENTYVFMCVNEILKNLGSVTWRIETRKNGEWVVDDAHPSNDLITKPNLKSSFTQLIKEMYVNYDLEGNFIVHKIRGVGGSVIGLECLPSLNITPKVDNSTKEILYYTYKNGSMNVKLEPSDVIHGKFYNPNDSSWGISKLEVLKKALDCDDKATEWNKSSMENRGVTDGAFVFDEVLDGDEFDEALASIKEKYANTAKGREPWLLHGGVKWVNMSRTPVEMDYLDSRKYTREEIAGVFGVPMLLLGVLENSSYNNMDTSKKLLWQDTIIPMLDEFFETLNFSLCDDFGVDWRISYDISNISVLQEDRSKKIDDALKLVDLGLSIDTINRLLDFGLTAEDLKSIKAGENESE